MQIFIHRDDRDIGPYSEAEVRSRLADGALSPNDFAWTEGMADWSPLSSFAAFKAERPSPPSTPPPLPTSRSPVPRIAAPPAGISRNSLGSYGKATLQSNETPLHRTVIHPIVMVGGFIVAGLVSVFFVLPMMFVAIADGHYGALLLLILPIIIALPGLIAVRTSELLITDRRVIIKVGWLQRRTLEMFISKIESVAVHQPLFGRMFGYGTVVIRGTGGSAEPFSKIAAPIEFRNAIQRVQGASESRR